jgi:hypothetical protein
MAFAIFDAVLRLTGRNEIEQKGAKIAEMETSFPSGPIKIAATPGEARRRRLSKPGHSTLTRCLKKGAKRFLAKGLTSS